MEDSKKHSMTAAQYYANRMKNDELFYQKERARLRAYKTSKYHSDPEYREQVINRAKESYYRRKEAKLQAVQ